MLQTISWDGKPTPRLGFGCASMMGRVGRRDSLRALHAAWDTGITLYDTARSYGYGEGEALLGEFLAASSRRAQAIVITKFGLPVTPMPRWKAAAKPLVRSALRLLPSARDIVRLHAASAAPRTYDIPTLRSSLEASLRALRTDHVDVLLVHEAPASLAAQDDLLAELQSLIHQGKALRAGVSASGRDLLPLIANFPPPLSVLQYPAQCANDWPSDLFAPRRRIANHPFHGPANADRVANGLAALAKSPHCDPTLREKLQGDRSTRLAEFWFARARQRSHPDIILTSMLHPSHLAANLAAIDSDRFSPDNLAAIDSWITAKQLIR